MFAEGLGRQTTTVSIILYEREDSALRVMALIFAFARQRGLRINSKGEFLRKLALTPTIIKKRPSVKSQFPMVSPDFVISPRAHTQRGQSLIKLETFQCNRTSNR